MSSRTPIIFSCLFGILLACLCIEWFLHITDVSDFDQFTQDAQSGLLTYKPHSSFEKRDVCLVNTVNVNNMGFHGFDTTLEKPENTKRIVTLGSSFVEALHVPRASTFSSELQTLLNNDAVDVSYEVVPVAFSGNGSYLNNLYYHRFASELKPDIVIVLMTGYEVLQFDSYKHQPQFAEDGSLILALPGIEERPFLYTLKRLARSSALVMKVHQQLIIFKENTRLLFQKRLGTTHTETLTYETQYDIGEHILRIWKTEEKLLSALSEQIKADGAVSIFAFWTNRGMTAEIGDVVREKLKEFGDTQGISLVFLDSSFESAEEVNGVPGTFPCDGHWNEAGHEYIAEGLYEFIKKEKIQ